MSFNNEFPIFLAALSPNSRGPSESFIQKLSFPLILGSKHRIAIKLATITNAWNTISSDIGNNSFFYITDLNVSKLITIPDGQYTVSQLNAEIFNQMLANSDASTVPAPISIIPLTTQGKVEVRITNNFKLDLTLPVSSTINNILGFPKVIIAATTIAPFRANFGNSIDGLLIGTSICQGSFANSNNSQVLAQIPITSGPSSTMNFVPNTLVFMNVVEGVFNEIRVFLSDTLGRTFPDPNFQLNGEAFSVEFIIRLME